MSKNIGAIIVDTERCKGCGLCVEACPKSLITLAAKSVNRKGYPYAIQTDERGLCNGCASCGIMCPDGCISVYRTKDE